MDWRNLKETFLALTPLDNVLGVGYGHKLTRGEKTGKPAIIVCVSTKMHRSDLSRNAVIPKQIDGMPTDVIEVGNVKLLSQRFQRLRPAKPGISIGHFKTSAGTFGAVVEDAETGEPLILSNNHVLANITNGNDQRAQVGDPVLQPGPYDGGTLQTSLIGHLFRYVPLQRETIASRCKIAKLFERWQNRLIKVFKPQYSVKVLRNNESENIADCAVAKPINYTDIDGEIFELGKLAGIKEPAIDLTIKKSGRSSGITYSEIIATDVMLRVELSEREYGLFSDQILAGPMSLPGDSGSLIVTDDNYVVGLLFAGSERATLFNRIANVINLLNIKFRFDDPAN